MFEATLVSRIKHSHLPILGRKFRRKTPRFILKQSGIRIRSILRKEITKEKVVHRGKMRKNISVDMRTVGDSSFVDVRLREPYAIVMIKGRRKDGPWFPLTARFRSWVSDHFPSDVEPMAVMISIARKGIKPHKFARRAGAQVKKVLRLETRPRLRRLARDVDNARAGA